jgi:hypothetical protein
MEAFDYVVALKILAAGSLVYGVVLFILIRFQRAFLFQNRLGPLSLSVTDAVPLPREQLNVHRVG